MSRFSQIDFTSENAQRLSVIIMPRIKKPALTPFRSLNDRDKQKFNKLMNEYIADLGEDWEDKLLKDFNDVAYDEVFIDTFQPEWCPIQLIDTDIKMLMTDEQKEFLENEKKEKKEQNMDFITSLS